MKYGIISQILSEESDEETYDTKQQQRNLVGGEMASKKAGRSKDGIQRLPQSVSLDLDTIKMIRDLAEEEKIPKSQLVEDLILKQLHSQNTETSPQIETEEETLPTILTVINFKGGVAKTTTASSLASCLGKLGKRVLVIDFDAQGNTSMSFNVFDKKKKEPCIVDVLFESKRGQGKMTLEEVMKETACANVKVVPSNMRFLKADAMIRNEDGAETLLQYAIQDMIDRKVENFDYIIIDLGPNLNMTTTNALVAMEVGNENSMVIIPVKLDEYSVVGIPEVIEAVENVAKARRTRTQQWRLLLTIVETSTKTYSEGLEELEKEVPDAQYFKTKIRKATKVNEATFKKRPFSDYAPRTQAAKDYRDLAKEIEAMHE